MGAALCHPADPRTMRSPAVATDLTMGAAFCKPVDSRTQFVATLDRVSGPTTKMVDALMVIRDRGLSELASSSLPPKTEELIASVEVALRCLVDAAFSIESIASRPATDTYKVLLRAKMQEVTCGRLLKCRPACERLRNANLTEIGEGAEALKEFLVAGYDAAAIYEEVKTQLPRLGTCERMMVEDPRGLSDQHAQLMAMGENDDFSTDPSQMLLPFRAMV